MVAATIRTIFAQSGPALLCGSGDLGRGVPGTAAN
jgi:hypothetical protein